MNVSSKALCWCYGLVALLALIGTWGNNLDYVGMGMLGATRQFWEDTLANPASRSITVDMLFLGFAMFVWMVLEARRLKMRGVWLYLAFGMLVAVSVTFPLFLVLRERALWRAAPPAAGGALRPVDAFGLVAIGLAAIAYALLTLQR